VIRGSCDRHTGCLGKRIANRSPPRRHTTIQTRPKPCQACVLAVVRQDGPVITELFAFAVPSSGDMGALNRVTSQPFGVDHAAALIVVVFVLSLGTMILGGHLRATRKRTRADME
jgi:hypothetical protein